jgi:pilus assembly protein Flp/PilA
MRKKLPKSNLGATVTALRERLVRDEQGATAIEYALIASGVGVAIAATVMSLGSATSALFASVAAAFH